jgi:hypothetical protein
MKHAKGMFKRWLLRAGKRPWKVRRKSSTPAVVPGAAPALAKAGVGGLCPKNLVNIIFLLYIFKNCYKYINYPLNNYSMVSIGL